MRWAIRIYALVLATYMAARSFDFMAQQAPVGAGADLRLWLPLLFLAASEVGMILWNEATGRATTKPQFVVATTMTWVDFCGSTMLGISDMIIRQQMIAYSIPREWAMLMMIGMPLLVATNVAMAILFDNFDAAQMRGRQAAALDWEAYTQAYQQLGRQRRVLAGTKRGAILADMEAEAADTTSVRVATLPAAIANKIANTERPIANTERPITNKIANTELVSVGSDGNRQHKEPVVLANPTPRRRSDVSPPD